MSDEVSAREVDPDAGLGLGGWVGDEEEGIALAEALEVARPLSEDGAVDGGPKTGGWMDLGSAHRTCPLTERVMDDRIR